LVTLDADSFADIVPLAADIKAIRSPAFKVRVVRLFRHESSGFKPAMSFDKSIIAHVLLMKSATSSHDGETRLSVVFQSKMLLIEQHLVCILLPCQQSQSSHARVESLCYVC
jgi:hypothetical protein